MRILFFFVTVLLITLIVVGCASQDVQGNNNDLDNSNLDDGNSGNSGGKNTVNNPWPIVVYFVLEKVLILAWLYFDRNFKLFGRK